MPHRAGDPGADAVSPGQWRQLQPLPLPPWQLQQRPWPPPSPRPPKAGTDQRCCGRRARDIPQPASPEPVATFATVDKALVQRRLDRARGRQTDRRRHVVDRRGTLRPGSLPRVARDEQTSCCEVARPPPVEERSRSAPPGDSQSRRRGRDRGPVVSSGDGPRRRLPKVPPQLQGTDVGEIGPFSGPSRQILTERLHTADDLRAGGGGPGGRQ